MSSNQDLHLQAIQTNNTAGLRKLYQEFLPRIANFIRKNGGSNDDAKDVFQEALVIIYKKAKAPDFKLTSGFYTLLYGICRNIWGNQLQKKSRSEVTLLDDYKYTLEPGLEPLLEDQEKSRLFWDAFKQLGADCQNILQLFFAKVKMVKIVEQLNLSSVSYAKKRKFQCKEKLIQLVKADARFLELAR